MISVIRYSSDQAELWNRYIEQSKNGLFMFNRSYMDYHSDRFTDHSLLFYDDGELVAILPMNEVEQLLISHGGLTYGGIISNNKMKQHTMMEVFEALIKYSADNGINKIRYKCVPHIYHKQPSEEDRFALFAHNAKLTTIDVSTYINLREQLKMSKGRKAQISRARREGVVVREVTELEDFKAFIFLENQILMDRHHVRAVHTGEELKRLRDSFPNNIHLVTAEKNNEMIAGVVVYEYETVIHTQYMAANDEARTIGGLDLVIDTIIQKYKDEKRWLDFGISTEHGKIYLNNGLCSQKESFGGRTGVYEIWELDI